MNSMPQVDQSGSNLQTIKALPQLGELNISVASFKVASLKQSLGPKLTPISKTGIANANYTGPRFNRCGINLPVNTVNILVGKEQCILQLQAVEH